MRDVKESGVGNNLGLIGGGQGKVEAKDDAQASKLDIWEVVLVT